MKPLNAKLLNEKIKQGWVATDFSEHLGITTEQFWQTLEKQFTRNAYTGFKSSINKNEKHQKRLSRASQHSFDTTLPSEEIIENETLETNELFDFEETSNVSTDAIVEEPNVSDNQSDGTPDSTSSEEPSIEELEKRLAERKEHLNNLELEHKKVVSSRISIKDEIREHKNALEEIQRKIAEHNAALSGLITRLDDTATTLAHLTSSSNLCRQEIANLTSQIEAAKKVCIFVYNSGEIELDSKLGFELPDWSTLFNNIVQEDELDSLTIKQIKALAQVIALTQFLTSIRASYEVSFENEISETYFKKVIS